MCVWGPGETSTLKGIVYPDSVVLSAATVGVQYQHRLVLSGDLSEGDVIMFLGSSGIHANGLTLAREIADELPEGYLTKLPDGSLYGEALLAPTHIYVRFLRACVEAGVRFSYIVNITGHGWRKLMRANEDFSYIIHTLPTEQPLFRFMQEWRNLPDREMYGNLNMGAGFALYVREGDVATVRRVAAEKIYGFDVFPAGVVAAPGPGGKRVVIEPLDGLIFEKEELEVR
jgi:phosphoribosylformylglycinamidine cyclo-ligase